MFFRLCDVISNYVLRWFHRLENTITYAAGIPLHQSRPHMLPLCNKQ